MKYRRKYTLFRVKAKGKPMWYFHIYLPDGTRRSKSTGCRSKEKAMMYVDSVLTDDAKIRKVFESDLIIHFKFSFHEKPSRSGFADLKGLFCRNQTYLKAFE